MIGESGQIGRCRDGKRAGKKIAGKNFFFSIPFEVKTKRPQQHTINLEHSSVSPLASDICQNWRVHSIHIPSCFVWICLDLTQFESEAPERHATVLNSTL